MSLTNGTHLQRWVLGAILAVFALYCDKASLGDSRGDYQQALWSLLVVGGFLVELRRTLRRARPALLALCLLSLHFFVMYLKRDAFPFHSSLFVIFWALVELVVLVIVYIRACQSIDPKGPFGLTEAEKQARKRASVHLG
jgi:hypothetical protein